jgi:phosphopantetheinyl transferase
MSFYIGLSLLSNLRVPGEAGLSGAQVRTREGRRVLRLLDEDSSIRDRPIHVESGGRPFFADHHADFSISHSHRMVAAAFSDGGVVGGPPRRVGCDVQRRLPFLSQDEISERFFHPLERRYMAFPQDPGERALRFCRLWVLKEAYLKMKGLSVFDMAGTPCFFSGKTSASMNFYLYEWGEAPEQYLLAVCREEEAGEAEPELRCFSQESLPLKNMEIIKAAVSPEKTVRPNM